jgi:molybdopterin-guanine dinucleotide biosynthesis protein A
VSRALILRLANELRDAVALAPCREGIWEPLLGRYSVSALPAVHEAIAADQRSLQKLFRRLGALASALPLDAEEARELFDWDTPEDLRR